MKGAQPNGFISFLLAKLGNELRVKGSEVEMLKDGGFVDHLTTIVFCPLPEARLVFSQRSISRGSNLRYLPTLILGSRPSSACRYTHDLGTAKKVAN